MERCRVINAKQDIDALHRQIKNSVDTALKKQSIIENFKPTLRQEERISELGRKK